MEISGSVIVVTGGGSGIGAAMARRFAAEGAAAVIVSDRDGDAAARVSASIAEETEAGGRGPVTVADQTDVSDEGAVQTLVARTLAEHGQIDLFCSNAGVGTGIGIGSGADEGIEDVARLWQRSFEVNVLAHVYAARAVLPSMLERGQGYLLNTASAAGLLTLPGDAAYTATKHAAVGLAEWLAVQYRPQGIGVSMLCPLGVATPLLLEPLAAGHLFARVVAASGEIISPEDVAEAVVAGLAAGTFLILPHPEVGRLWARKAADPDRWVSEVSRAFAS